MSDLELWILYFTRLEFKATFRPPIHKVMKITNKIAKFYKGSLIRL